MSKTLVHLVTGFLGSGKTTFLRNALTEGIFTGKVAVLVNELGEVGIDGALIKAKSKSRGMKTVELTNGCICCEIRGDFVQETESLLRKYKPRRLLIESTGIAEPGRILQAFYEIEPLKKRTQVEPVVCVVDARTFEYLVKELTYHYVCQIKTADVVLLNKCSLVRPAVRTKIEKAIHKINPKVFIYRTDYCKGDFEKLLRPIELDRLPYRAGVIKEQMASDHDDPFNTFVWRGKRKNFDFKKLESWLKNLPNTLFRLKGYVTIDNKTHLVSFSTGIWDFEPEPKRRDNVLVFIGINLKRTDVLPGLKKAFYQSRKPTQLKH